MFARITLIVVLFVVGFFFFKPEPKTSIYLYEEYQNELMSIYDQKMKDWPDDTEDIFIESSYGEVHVLACGLKENPPLVMVHAASMGAHSWAENLGPLLDHYRVYSIEQKNQMDLPILLFLGTEDRIVGDADIAEQIAREFPGIRTEILASGHLIAVEHAEYVNRVVREFLSIPF